MNCKHATVFYITSTMSSIIREYKDPGSGFLVTVLGISTVLYCGKKYFATVIININHSAATHCECNSLNL